MEKIKNRLNFWHIHCMNCGEKICTYYKKAKIDEEKICEYCKEKINILINLKVHNSQFPTLFFNERQTTIINCRFCS